MSKQKLLNNLHTNLLRFFDDMISLLPNETIFALGKITMETKYTQEEIMDNAIYNLKYKELVEKRDEKLFYKQNFINRLYFKPIWDSLNQEHKTMIWKYLLVFLETAEKYEKLN